MTKPASKPPELPQTDWFRANAFHPALPGYYKVRGGAHLPFRSPLRLVGVDLRFWNGSVWLTWERGLQSVFGRHASHEWCGQRRWVLRRLSGGEDAFLISARPGMHAWTRLAVEARPFPTERQARRFSDRHPRLGLTAVLA
jgi:hypothetical protein